MSLFTTVQLAAVLGSSNSAFHQRKMLFAPCLFQKHGFLTVVRSFLWLVWRLSHTSFQLMNNLTCWSQRCPWWNQGCDSNGKKTNSLRATYMGKLLALYKWMPKKLFSLLLLQFTDKTRATQSSKNTFHLRHLHHREKGRMGKGKMREFSLSFIALISSFFCWDAWSKLNTPRNQRR